MIPRMRLFYSTRERYPTTRVDLTELITNGLVLKGHCVDWHMQGLDEGRTRLEQIGPAENVYVGRCIASGSGVRGALNTVLAFAHDMAMLRIVRHGKYDVVQVRDKVVGAIIGLAIARRMGLPFYYWMSFPYPEADSFRAQDREIQLSAVRRIFYWLRGAATTRLLYHTVLPRADHIFVQSDRMKADLMERGIPAERMTPVPMGVNLDKVKDVGDEPIDDTRLIGRKPLVYVGTMVRVRRIDMLIEMMPRILERHPTALLVLVGDGPREDMGLLERAADRLGVRNSVLFTGFVPAEQAWGYIKAASLCLSPIRPSPMFDSASPTKMVEYLALGRPVVASRHPEQSRILEASKAGLAVSFDAAAFGNAVEALLDDPETAEEMGRRGVEHVTGQRDYAGLVDYLESRYLELLEARRPSTGQVSGV